MIIELRIALLVIGLAVLVALYFFGRSKKHTARRNKSKEFNFEEDGLPDPLDPDSRIHIVTPARGVQRDLDDPDDPEDSTGLPDGVKLASGYQASLLEEESEEVAQTEKLVVLHVMAKPSHTFSGTAIADFTRELELEYDDMHVFHKKVTRISGKKALYSIVNAVKPGTFGLDSMDVFETPGISFVMSLPGPEEGLKAFNIMLETARKAAECLHGDLLDETRDHLSLQTIARLQEDVQLFSLKYPHQGA